MLAFFHAMSAGHPLKQVVMGLDFYAYSPNFALLPDFLEQRFADGTSDAFARFLDERYPGWQPRGTSPPLESADPIWNEALYLAVNQDVAAAVAQKFFTSGRDHYERAGRVERRQGGYVPPQWDEESYLIINTDVNYAVMPVRPLHQRLPSLSGRGSH